MEAVEIVGVAVVVVVVPLVVGSAPAAVKDACVNAPRLVEVLLAQNPRRESKVAVATLLVFWCRRPAQIAELDVTNVVFFVVIPSVIVSRTRPAEGATPVA